MRYHVLACDYDGTLAEEGVVSDATLEALERLRRSHRKLVMVTGRVLEDLEKVFPRFDLFDRIVAENGLVLHRPETRETIDLGPPFDPLFVAALKERGVSPLGVGRCIVATWEPHQDVVLETIRDLGLELQVIFNKGAVMVLPSSVNKATGLRVALEELALSPRNAVGVGDAENDHAFLASCECGVAVANALPVLQDRADWVTKAPRGAGVVELIDRLLEDDLASLRLDDKRECLLLGHLGHGGEAQSGEPVHVPSHDVQILVAGTSGSGKTTFTRGIVERLGESGLQHCVIDPEGDYEEMENVTTLGDADRAPTVDDVMQLLEHPEQNVSVNLVGMELGDRPRLFLELLARILELRARTGRPHWMVVDEAHHLFPVESSVAEQALSPRLSGVLWVTVEPQHLAAAVISGVDHVVVIGREPSRTLTDIAAITDHSPPKVPTDPLEPGDALYWAPGTGHVVGFRVASPRLDLRRHKRKYAEGTLPEEASFYFRGPEGRLRLRAPNLIRFLELAEGVDDDTWMHHLRRADVSDWVRERIKDPELAQEIAVFERDETSPRASRDRIRRAIQERYTLPA